MNRQQLPDGTIVFTAGDLPARRVERRAERVTLALLLIWLGVMASITEPRGMTAIGSGVILLGSSLYRKFTGRHGGLVTGVFGAILLGTGIGDATSHTTIPWFGITLVILGLWVLARAFRRAF